MSKLAWLTGGWLLLLLLAGCATTPPPRFYLLTTLPEATEKPIGEIAEEVVIGVGPVRLANYLDRPQIVTRQDGNRLQVNEFDRWGETLDSSVARIVAQNLSQLLRTSSVVHYPWERAVNPGYQVTIDLLTLDLHLDGRLELSAQWRVIGDDGRLLRRIDRTHYREQQLPSADFADRAAAVSRGIGRLSEEIAGAIVKIAEAR